MERGKERTCDRRTSKSAGVDTAVKERGKMRLLME